MEYIGLHTEDEHRVAFVVFRCANDARRASVFKAHTIAGNVVDVTRPDAVAQSSNLLNMPVDCLEAIMRQLELKDLCSMAGVCLHFKALASEVFKSKWKNLHLIVNNVRDMQELFLCFAPEIKSICIKPSDGLRRSQHNSILNVLVQHCSGTLTHLEMHNFSFETNSQIIRESYPLLCGLQKLILRKCTVSVKWFVPCRQLVELELIDTHVTYNGAQYQSCEELKTLRIYGSKTWVGYGLHLFLDQNHQLKTLEVLPLLSSSNRSYSSYGEIFYCVPTSIENLSTVPAERTRLNHLVSLKTLRLEAAHHNQYAAMLINGLNNATLERLELDLNYFRIDTQNAEAIGRLRKINTLKLHCSSGCSSTDLLEMVKNLNDLSDLVLSTHTNQLSAPNVLTLIERNPNLQLLCLSFADNGDSGHKLQMNDQIYREMHDVVWRRRNGKSLRMVIVGRRNQITKVDVAFRMQTSLSITCFSTESLVSLLQLKPGYYQQKHIKMTDEILDKLRDRGLCP